MHDPTELARITYRWERVRALFTGLIELMWQPAASIVLLVLIRGFDNASALQKSVVSASGFIGFLLTPMTVMIAARLGWAVSRVNALLYLITGLLILAAPLMRVAPGYVALTTLANIVMVQHTPLLTHLYGNHFVTEKRGARLANLVLIASLVTIVGNLIVARVFDAHLGWYRGVFVLVALACFASAFCLFRIPSRPLDRREVGNPWHNLGLIWRDRLFGWMLSAWMLMGFGNLMTLPLRTEYMANPAYGVNASNGQILLITGALPLLVRLVLTQWLGRGFDRWNLVAFRVILNVLFLLSILLFFSTRHLAVMGLSMALLGVAMAGGHITWALWVTKLAPPGKTSAYMSMHLLTTGLRGCLGPFVGFYLMTRIPPAWIGGIGCVLILVATLMFLPAHRHIDLRRAELDA